MRVFFLLSVTFGLASSLPNPILRDENLDITVINKGLDLFEGDIKTTATKSRRRRSIRSALHRWPLPVPYDFEWSLDMNAKGVILRAFEQFRLKTCIDFRPQFGNEQHISIKKDTGCWSKVGKNDWEQELSIGSDCDTVATVEHELMHALGFWHEQSRYDRDNYISINWGNIEAGEERNFKIGTNDTNSTMGTPYDYFSVMHYPKDAFSNGNGSTIITKLPEFQDVIGQRLDMSHYDVEELNKFYSCNESISFLDHCSFDNDSMCGMSVCSKNLAGWERVRQAVGGPRSDHSYLGSPSQGFFMHFSTKGVKVGNSAKMETRRMTPRRSCKVQCLEFFYYHSGSWSDQLNIWIREFDGVDDVKGTRRLMGQIKGSPAHYWQLFHVPLNATKTFQVEFEARKGTGQSSGGFSVDDINLSETECPHQTWQIRDFEGQLNANTNSSVMFSPQYYSSDGYSYQIATVLTRDYLVVFARLVSGISDYRLQWPCPWRQITFMLLDQNPHIQKRMSKQSSITTSPLRITSEYFGRPLFWGTLNVNGFRANKAWPHGLVMTTTQLRSRDFLKGGDAFLLISMEDISRLRYSNNLRCPTVNGKSISVSPLSPTKDDGPCGTKIPTPSTSTTSTHPPTTTSSTTASTLRMPSTTTSTLPATTTTSASTLRPSTNRVTTQTTTTITGGRTTVYSQNPKFSTVRASDNPPVTPPDRCNNIFSVTCYKTEISPGALMLVILFVFIFGMLCKSCCCKTKRDIPLAENRVFMQMQ